MSNLYFTEALVSQIQNKKSYVCIGLDPTFEGEKCIPSFLLEENKQDFTKTIIEFNKTIIDATHHITPIYKLQSAFYEKYFAFDAIKLTINHIHAQGCLAILDAKRNDIGNTAQAYAYSVFENYKADATTVNAYFGIDGVKPFMDYEDKGIFILVKTSNPSSEQFQDLFATKIEGYSEQIMYTVEKETILKRNYVHMADLVNDWALNGCMYKGYSRIGAVVGATYPFELHLLRRVLPKSFILIPGYGTQGGTAEAVVKGINPDGYGAIINSSRSIDYAYSGEIGGKFFTPEEFAEAALESAELMRMEINTAIEKENLLPW
ncbi:MAG: orotidine-5'-phosphate decarboxylase [Candidatus Lokiarchaeota archaeon]|nr:orotidine-5'-phosphate decarboxylase [Candidatus Lokiarchaeota archaeon]